MKDYFFFNVFRKTLIQFLDAFNDIKIARYTPDGKAIEKYVEVPIKLSIKEKVWYWLNQRKDDEMLPMITAWISSIDWASERAVNDKFVICKGVNTETKEAQTFLHPIPYNLTVTMNVWTLHMVDIDQIMEQILPFFAPHIFIRVSLEELGTEFDVKVIFRSATPELSHEMGDEDYRVINYTLDFELQTWFFKPVESSKLIDEIFGSMFTNPKQFVENVSDTSTTSEDVSAGKGGGTVIQLKGKVEDSELIIKYNLFQPCDSAPDYAISSSSSSSSSSLSSSSSSSSSSVSSSSSSSSLSSSSSSSSLSSSSLSSSSSSSSSSLSSSSSSSSLSSSSSSLSSSSTSSSSSSSSQSFTFETVLLSPELSDGVFEKQVDISEGAGEAQTNPADSYNRYHEQHSRAINFIKNIISSPPTVGYYRCYRSFFTFDSTNLITPSGGHSNIIVLDSRFKFTAFVNDDGSGIIQKGILSDPINPVVTDFNNFTSPFSSEITFNPPNTQTTVQLNTSGADYIQEQYNSSDYIQIFIRQWKDYTGSSAGATNTAQCGLYFQNQSVVSRRPILEVDVKYWSSSSVSSSSSSVSSSSSSSSSVSSSSVSSSSSSLSSSSRSNSSSSSSFPALTFLIHAPDDNTGEAVVLTSLGSQSPFSTEGMTYVYRSVMLPDGRVVVSGYDGDGPVLVLCYKAKSTTILSWSYTIVGSLFSYYSDVCVLTNGNIVVMYIDYAVPERPYFVILDSDGVLVQGPTDCDPSIDYDANYEEPNHVIAMDDGGFFCYWIEDGTYPCASVWNGDGTIRVPYDYFNSDIDPAAPVQMPTGGGGTYAGWFVISQSYCCDGVALVDPTNMSNVVYGIAQHISNYPLWIYMAVIPSWNDRIAVLWKESTGIIYYMILLDDGTTVSGQTQLILPTGSVSINDLIVLTDGNLLMMYSESPTEYGAQYYILDTSDNTELSVLSGPHTAFTGLTAHPDQACHGATISVSSSSMSSSSMSSSSVSVSSSSMSSSSMSSSSESSLSLSLVVP